MIIVWLSQKRQPYNVSCHHLLGEIHIQYWMFHIISFWMKLVLIHCWMFLVITNLFDAISIQYRMFLVIDFLMRLTLP